MRRGPDLDVFLYLDYRKYLNDWFTAQKEADSRFSHRYFAKKAGVSSPSLLKEVVAGRRNLTPITVEGFVGALRLDKEGAAFFRDLVQLDQAVTDEERSQALIRVAASRRFRSARPIEGPSAAYLAHWYIPAIRELALCKAFQPDAAWIAAELSPSITEQEAADALEVLFELGMLVRGDDGVTVADVSVVTPHEVTALLVLNYHQQMARLAVEAIPTVDYTQRHSLGVTVAIPQDLIPELKAELDAFQERILHICDARAADAERVYQINLQLAPLSRGGE